MLEVHHIHHLLEGDHHLHAFFLFARPQVIFPRQEQSGKEVQIKGSASAVSRARLRLQLAVDSALQVYACNKEHALHYLGG
jgi:hypothetical protein